MTVRASVIYRAVLLAFALAVAGFVFRELMTVMLAGLIVVIAALPLSAFTTMLERRGVPRAVGALIGVGLGLGVVAGLIAAVVPVFTHEVDQFVASLPRTVDQVRHRLGALTGTSPSRVGQQVQRFAAGYTQHPSRLLGPAESVGAGVVTGLGAIVVIVLTALYTAIQPQPLVEGLVRVFPPERRPHIKHVLARLRTAYLGWLRGLAIGMVVLGVLTYAGLELVGLGFAAFFAVLTAISMIVPYYGAIASSIPPILYALTISPTKALIVAVIYIFSHLVEANIVEPLVVARQVKLHPAAVALGVVAVERLLGLIGLIVAIPVLVTIKILLEEFWINPLEQRRPPRRSEKPGPSDGERARVPQPVGHDRL